MAFFDLKEAFDTVKWNKLFKIPWNIILTS